MPSIMEIAAEMKAAEKQLEMENSSVHAEGSIERIAEDMLKERASANRPKIPVNGVREWQGLDIGGSTAIEHGRDALQTLLGGYVQVDVGQPAWGTSLNLLPSQIKGQASATKEVLKGRILGAALQGDKVEKFLETEGDDSYEGMWNRAWSDVLEPTFDTLAAGQYMSAYLARDYLRNNLSWESFSKAAEEFEAAMPYMDRKDREKLSYIDLFNEEGYSAWYHSVGGFALDILLDPLTYIPYFGVGKAIGKTVRAGGKLVGKAGSKVSVDLPIVGDTSGRDLWQRVFKPERELRETEAGEQAYKLTKEAEVLTNNEILGMQDTVKDIVSMMTPTEQVMFGAFMDQGKNFVLKELEGLAKSGVIDGNRLPELSTKFDEIRKLTDEMTAREIEKKLIDETALVADYVHQTGAMDPRVLRAQQKIANVALGKAGRQRMREARRPQHDGILPSGRQFGPGERAEKATTVMDRLEKVLAGDIHSGVELNIGNILIKRGADSIRHLNQRKLVDNIIASGNNSALVDEDIIKQAQAAMDAAIEFRNIGTSKGREIYNEYLEKELKANPGMSVYDVRMKTRPGGKDAPLKEEIVGAWLMPTEIVTYLKKMETLQEPGTLEKAAGVMDGFLNVWRGWATLGTAYHSRNYQSMLFNNWMAGVGTDYNLATAMKDLFTKKQWNIVPGKFALRHLQALRVQMMADGAGRLPDTMKKAADAMAQKAGLKSFDDVAMPKTIEVDGVAVSLDEVIAQGHRYDVPQSATKLYNMDTVVGEKLFPRLGEAFDAKALDQEALSQGTRTVLSIGADRKSFSEHISSIFGTNNPMLKANRAAGQIVENNGRWALYLDRLMKGSSFEEAAQATKKWHFDYRNLTNTEKLIFRNVLPFYAWTRFAAPRMFMSLLEQPEKYGRLGKVKNMIESWGGQEREQSTPDYYDEVQAFQLPYIRDDKQLFMQLDLPFLEINRLNTNDIQAGLNPIAKLFIETRTDRGTSLFTGAPLERYPGELSEGFGDYGVTKKAEHSVTSFLPPLGKIARYVGAKTRGEGPLQAVSEILGVKIRALDKPRYFRGKTYANQSALRNYNRRGRDALIRLLGKQEDDRE